MITIDSDLTYVDLLVKRIEDFLSQDVLEMTIDGQAIRGYRSPDARSVWIRDYSDIIRGARYFESDLKAVVRHFADNQSMNGRIFDYFTTYPEKTPCERENWTKYVRVPVEADVEYRFIKGAWVCYQAHGDRQWLQDLLPHLERAIAYTTTDAQRWDPEYQLVKRPYTIDTWDFAYTAGKHEWLQFQIDQQTFWGIFHGDNSGLYEALAILSLICSILHDEEKATRYQSRAEALKQRLNATCWNGSFYTHFYKLSDVQIAGLDEGNQLSLSNPVSLNRGVGTHEMAAAMIREYQFRQDQTLAFAPWFSIEPPFPDGIFGDEKLIAGAYINGGIFPMAGGELALLALENGYEQYGFQQIMQYEELTRNNETYLWYFPNGEPSTIQTSTSPEATPTDGWGSASFLHAVIQGLAGITDLEAGFRKILFAPRWAGAFSKKATVSLDYPASGKKLTYSYTYLPEKMIFELMGDFEELQAHIYQPNHCRVQEVLVNEQPVSFERVEVNDSKYIDFQLFNQRHIRIQILFDTINL